MEAMREIELRGHIIDSFLLPKVFDKVMDMNGEFEILEFEIGKHKTDTSYARLMIRGKDQDHLDDIFGELHRLGAYVPEAEDAVVAEAPKDKVVPKGFYSTTNHPTYVKVDGEWLRVKNQKMDSLIVLKNGSASCKTIGHIKKGDRVVIGNSGIRVVPPERPRGHTIFDFMGSQVSSERPSQSLIREIAEEVFEAHERGGKIVVVGGPAIVHTGGQQALAELVRKGYVDALLAGNALAVHDVEYNLYGTSLGMGPQDGRAGPRGPQASPLRHQRDHEGGLVEGGRETGRAHGRHYVRVYRKRCPVRARGLDQGRRPPAGCHHGYHEGAGPHEGHVKDADIVLMMATMLHSIATGNCLSSSVRTICVDINPATVTKLMDRGTAQAIGIVTDVGTFLPWLAEELDNLEKSRKKQMPALRVKNKKR